MIPSISSPDLRGSFSRIDIQDLEVRKVDLWSIGYSVNAKVGTFRGIHLQKTPHEQAKIVWVSKGKLIDIVVDLRKNASTYLRWSTVNLEAGGKAIVVPKGFGHGYLTLEDITIVNYLFDSPYLPESSRTINVRDATLNINFDQDIRHISISDANAPTLIEFLRETSWQEIL